MPFVIIAQVAGQSPRGPSANHVFRRASRNAHHAIAVSTCAQTIVFLSHLNFTSCAPPLVSNIHRVLLRPTSGGGGGPGSTASDSSLTSDKRSCLGDFATQTMILTKKNFLVQVRSTTALATQLLIGVIFLGILRLMQLSIETNPVFTKDFFTLRNPEVRSISLPARCVSHAWEGGCYSFVATPRDGSSLGTFAADVSRKMAVAAGFEGEGVSGGYYMFNNTEEVDDWLFKNQNATPVAIHFHNDGSANSKVSYTVQYNGTRNCNVIGVLDCTDPSFDLMASFQVCPTEPD